MEDFLIPHFEEIIGLQDKKRHHPQLRDLFQKGCKEIYQNKIHFANNGCNWPQLAAWSASVQGSVSPSHSLSYNNNKLNLLVTKIFKGNTRSTVCIYGFNFVRNLLNPRQSALTWPFAATDGCCSWVKCGLGLGSPGVSLPPLEKGHFKLEVLLVVSNFSPASDEFSFSTGFHGFQNFKTNGWRNLCHNQSTTGMTMHEIHTIFIKI